MKVAAFKGNHLNESLLSVSKGCTGECGSRHGARAAAEPLNFISRVGSRGKGRREGGRKGKWVGMGL